jgi:ribosomal protein S18 acetylase RimI-like enzyme
MASQRTYSLMTFGSFLFILHIMIEHDSSDYQGSFSKAADMANLSGQKLSSSPEISYVSPAEQSPDDYPQHKFELLDGQDVVGGAEIDYYSKPLPLYHVTDLWVDWSYAGVGNASKIMERVEEFLVERKKPGVLVEAIIDGSPSQGMYERRGWKPVPGGLGLHTYNWPEDISLKILDGYALRYTSFEEREESNNI